MDKMREEFEAWAISCEMCTYLDNAEYRHQSTEWAWRAWQASRSSICVQMPRCCNEEQDSYRLNMMDSLDDAGVRYE